jgi:TolB-like protein
MAPMDIRFGELRLKTRERQLLGPMGAIELSDRSFDILLALLSRPNQLVEKSALFDAAWPGIVVEENTLQVHMSALRKAVGADLIATVHGRGYRYAGPAPIAVGEREPATGRDTNRKPVIAVLPFENLSGDPQQQFFSDGISEDITDRLTRFPLLAVIGQHSAFAFRGNAPDVSAIREKLKADFIVTGSVRRAGDRVRIAARLSDATNETAIWAERYDRPLTGIFELQDELTNLIAAAVAKQLDVEIAARSASGKPTSFASYELILRGNWHFNQLTRAAAMEALACFQRALEIEPRNAEVIGSLAICHSSKWLFDYARSDLERTIALATEGLNYDPANTLCHSVRGLALVWHKGLEAGRDDLDKGVELNPSGWFSLANRSLLSTYEGKPEEARRYLSRSRQLNPIPPIWLWDFECISYFGEERYELVLPGVEAIPEGIWDGMYQMACYGHLGMREQARTCMARLRTGGRNADLMAVAAAEPYADPSTRTQLQEGVRKALAY